MKRRSFVKGSAAVTATFALTPLASSVFAQSNPSRTHTPLKIALSSPGRLGFYIDYSERSDVGTHTFYVCRTHGTSGAVSVNYATEGDAHNAVSGTLSWADGEADIKSFTVNVPSKSAGDHRISAVLSNPTGGAVLHFGNQHTRAYGVIDDGSIAPDSEAVFFDTTASTNGNGSQTSPFDNIYDAIKATGGKRYLYGAGIVVPNGTNGGNISGGGFANYINVPAGRSGESSRLYIRNWPGKTFTVDGSGSTNTIGFYTRGGESYQTYRGINFTNLNTTSLPYAEMGGIVYHYGNSSGINIELCNARNINGSTNTGAFMPWGVDGFKVWRSTADGVAVQGSNTNANSCFLQTYDGKNGSVQRCEAYNCGNTMFHKRVQNAYDTSTSVRFCISNTEYGVHYGASGSAGVAHSYTIVQGNVFYAYRSGGGQGFGIFHWPGQDGRAGTNQGEKHWWCNNVFFSRAQGTEGAIHFRQAYSAAIFNNIYVDCSRLWVEYSNASAYGPDIEFADHNLDFDGAGTRYVWRGTMFSDSASLRSAANSSFGANDISSNPGFDTGSQYGVRLTAGSPAAYSGVGGSAMGAYLTGIEVLGANNLTQQVAPPQSPPGFSASAV